MIEIRVKASKSQPEGDHPGRWEQKRPPAFELPDVHSFMRTAHFHAGVVAGNDDVTECRSGASTAKPAAAQKAAGEAAVNFKYAVAGRN